MSRGGRSGIVVLLGIGLLGIGRLGVGAATGAAAGADNPEAELIFNAGVDHLREGRPDLAIEEFDRAIKKDPKNPYFYKGLAVAYLSQNKTHDAIGALRKSLDLNPYYVDARNDLGAALLLAGQREEGKKELIRAYDDAMNPTPEVTSRNLGRAYLSEKNYDRALSWFRKSVQRNKRYPDGQLGVADTLIAMGKVEDAVAHLESAVIATGDHADIVLALGEAYYRAGRFADARRRLEQVVQKSKDPASPTGQRAAELLKNLPR
jgi:tetratricopeptide (TPR) repeat protein